MCGIVFATDFTGKPVNKWIKHQFNQQRHRGTQGFGLLDGDYNHLIKNPKEQGILSWLDKYKSSEILFHHRMPTSTENVQNACHPFSTRDYFDKNYVLVHNGWITNADEMKAKHTKLGITYSSDQPDGTFNDSEALLWEVALCLEGLQTEIEAYGAIAFICIEKDKDGNKKLHYGRNTNPLNQHFTNKHLYLSSEGQGKAIDSHKLFTYDYKSKGISSKDFTIPSYDNTYNWDNYDQRKYFTHGSLFEDEGYTDKDGKFHYWDYDDGDYDYPAITVENKGNFAVVKSETNTLKETWDITNEYKDYMERANGKYSEVALMTDADIELCRDGIQDTDDEVEKDMFRYQLKVLLGVQEKLLRQEGYVNDWSVDPTYADGKIIKTVTQGMLKALNG